MSATHPVDLLRESISLAALAVIRAAEVPHSISTPCREWSLGTLVRHVSDSARSLQEMLTSEPPGEPPLPGCSAAQAVFADLDRVAAAASRLDGAVALTALTGSYELTLHAWDVDQATSTAAELPRRVVEALLVQAPLVLAHGERSGLFGPEIAACVGQTDLDRLLALFGRSSDWRSS
ncbi:hypothetical protein SAMN04487968_10953 [Nocardioides terrae]|uniref:Mycothiol-dependent maleylpyruvate isomerase metal-binding domain-containing protein n=1 Tax=Nocardioides terrae TaxID=574651 RepID=A0A1I1KYQ8_9ACTN|nr:maleylpyruvate isomerase N-terminal domain-containing protein [Nocardioides terrae]SFC65412.1 hypothetical protein SAMN04487968_10953 [Nocardioides terrae]